MYREGVDMSIQKEIEGKMLEIIKDGITGCLCDQCLIITIVKLTIDFIESKLPNKISLELAIMNLHSFMEK